MTTPTAPAVDQPMMIFWVPGPIVSPTYTIHKVSEYQPGAARRKLREDNIAYMMSYVPPEIKSKHIPTIIHWELLSANGTKLQFDIVNYTDNEFAFDENLLLKMNGQKLYRLESENMVCSFTPDDCQLIVYIDPYHHDLRILNKDVPKQGQPVGSTEWHLMIVQKEVSGKYKYESRRIFGDSIL